MADTLYRTLTNKRLKKLRLTGRVLDLGGDTASGYHKLMGGTYSLTRVNIDASTKPDLLFDLEHTPIPLSDSSYDAVLLINVLEHVYNRDLVLEAHRLLKKGGRMILVVPFLHQVHGSPRDYVRYTREGLTRLLEEAGFGKFVIEEIGWGAFSAAYNLLHRFIPGFLSPLLTRVVLFKDWLALTLSRRLGKQYRGDEYALGYFVEAVK